jgi:hypothetical protein
MKPQCVSPIVSLFVAIFVTIAVAIVPSQAAAQCAAPTTSGVHICQPSANSVISGAPHIESAAEPSSGSITSMTVTVDGHQIFTNAGPEVNLFSGGIENGTHHMVISAHDNFGRTYQASETFSVTGNAPTSCPTSTVGVRICYPAAGQFVSQNLLMTFGFKGAANITHVRTYVDNKVNFDFSPSPGQQSIEGQGSPTTPGNHTLTAVAWDAQGHVYSSKVGFTAFYDGSCPPKGDVCLPGIYSNGPFDGADVTSPFRISFNVENNPAPITTMKAYLNGQVVAISSGPSLDQQVNANKGTHILTIQAWDTAGKLYRSVQNVNVQ